ncbi:unnamed protein product [Caenorhabditis nigoni]
MDDPDLGQNSAPSKPEPSEKLDVDEIARFAIEMGIVDMNANDNEEDYALMEYETPVFMDEPIAFRKERARMDKEDRQRKINDEVELSEYEAGIMKRTTEREYAKYLKMQSFLEDKTYKEVDSDGESVYSLTEEVDEEKRRKPKKSPTKKRIPVKTRAAKKAEMFNGMSKEEIRQVRSGRHPIKKVSKIGGKKRGYSEISISEEDSSAGPSSPLEGEHSKYKNIGVQIFH